jgi:hypothetical protein
MIFSVLCLLPIVGRLFVIAIVMILSIIRMKVLSEKIFRPAFNLREYGYLSGAGFL